MPYPLRLLLLSALGVVVGCQDKSVAPLALPNAEEIDQAVVITHRSPGGPTDQEQVVVKGAKKIDALLAFLNQRNGGWRKTWDTFPTPQTTVRLMKGNDIALVIWLGPGWLGGRGVDASAAGNQMRDLSAKDRAELVEILGIEAE